MSRRWGGDYWHHYPRARPKAVKDGLKAKSQRGAIGETWWSKRWLDLLHSFGMGARLDRGRRYARQGQVVSMDVESGKVTAKVQGTRPKPYSITIEMKPLSDKDWEKVLEVMAAKAIFAAKLLAGEMPKEIEETFTEAKRPLFPTREKDLDTDCSCPDWANPCKHIAAVYFLLAERFDEDPFMIFKLRGRTKEQIIESLRQKRGALQPVEEAASTAAPEAPGDKGVSPLEACLDSFWQAGPSLADFTPRPPLPESDKVILKRLGDSPFALRGENLTQILARAYDAVSAAAQAKASEETPEA
jgi:uncharacterized Zn finger protein